MKQIAFIILLTSITACGPKTDPEFAADQWCDCYSMNSDKFTNDTLLFEHCLKGLTDNYEFFKIHIEVFYYPPLYDSIYSSGEVDSARMLIREFNVYSKKLCPDAPLF
jgi:hypothetical protein